MSRSGNLKTMDLAELLQWVAMGRKTGALAFVKDKTKNYIVFREGSIISSGSNEPTYQLGQYLLFQGKLTESDFKRAFELEQETRGTLSPMLVLQGFVSQQDLQQAMIDRTEEVIYDLFLWEAGDFNFTTALAYDAVQLYLINVNVNSEIFDEGLDYTKQHKWPEAIAVFQKVLETDPQNFRAYDQIEQAEKAICQDLYKNLLPPDKVPYLLIPVSLLKKFELTHREGYVAS